MIARMTIVIRRVKNSSKAATGRDGKGYDQDSLRFHPENCRPIAQQILAAASMQSAKRVLVSSRSCFSKTKKTIRISAGEFSFLCDCKARWPGSANDNQDVSSVLKKSKIQQIGAEVARRFLAAAPIGNSCEG